VPVGDDDDDNDDGVGLAEDETDSPAPVFLEDDDDNDNDNGDDKRHDSTTSVGASAAALSPVCRVNDGVRVSPNPVRGSMDGSVVVTATSSVAVSAQVASHALRGTDARRSAIV
jgi:hypothetical protein